MFALGMSPCLFAKKSIRDRMIYESLMPQRGCVNGTTNLQVSGKSTYHFEPHATKLFYSMFLFVDKAALNFCSSIEG